MAKTKPSKAKKAPAKKTKTVAKAVPVEQQEKRGRGRPSEYKPEYADLIGNLYLLGMTDAEVATHMGISPQTLYNWKAKYPELLEADVYKAIADAEVVAAARKKATGYTYETEKVVGNGDNARVVKVKVHIPGDTTAQQFWLRNRRRLAWGDTKQVEVGGPGDFNNMSEEDLIREIAREERELAALGLLHAEPGSDAVN